MHLDFLEPVSSTECFLFFSILNSPQDTLLEGEGSGYSGWWLDVMQHWLFIGIEAAFFIHRIAVFSTSVMSNSLQLHELYVAQQAPLAMGILQAEYWSGLPFLPPRDFPHLGTEPESLVSPALAGGFFTTSITWEVWVKVDFMNKQQSEYGPFTTVFQLPTIRADRNLCPFWFQILSDSVQPYLCEPIPQLIHSSACSYWLLPPLSHWYTLSKTISEPLFMLKMIDVLQLSLP